VSNALSVLGQMMSSSGPAGSQAAGPASQASDGPVLLSLAAVGVCTLAVWIIRRLMYPRKFTLAKTPGRHNTVSPLHLLPIFVLWYVVQAAVVSLPRIPLAPGSFERKTLAILAGQAFMIAGSLAVAAATFRHGLRRGFGLSMRHWIYDSWRGVIGYLVIFPVCWGVFYLTVSLLPEKPPPHEMLLAARGLQGVWRLLVILSVVLLAPLAEEMFFRGLLQSMLRRYVGPWGAILATSAIFAGVHVGLAHTMPALFLLALALGYNYERCGRIYPSILIHTIFNGVFLWQSLSANG